MDKVILPARGSLQGVGSYVLEVLLLTGYTLLGNVNYELRGSVRGVYGI